MISRFIPFIRHIATIVAGIGDMRYGTFLFWSLIANIVWVFTFVTGGYLIGILPVVRGNFNLVIYALLLISLVALVW